MVKGIALDCAWCLCIIRPDWPHPDNAWVHWSFCCMWIFSFSLEIISDPLLLLLLEHFLKVLFSLQFTKIFQQQQRHSSMKLHCRITVYVIIRLRMYCNEAVPQLHMKYFSMTVWMLSCCSPWYELNSSCEPTFLFLFFFLWMFPDLRRNPCMGALFWSVFYFD